MEGKFIETTRVGDASDATQAMSLSEEDVLSVMTAGGTLGEGDAARILGRRFLEFPAGSAFTIFVRKSHSRLIAPFLQGAARNDATYRFIVTFDRPKADSEAFILILEGDRLLRSSSAGYAPLFFTEFAIPVKESYLLTSSATEILGFDPLTGIVPLLIPPPYNALSPRKKERLLLLAHRIYFFLYEAELGLVDPTKPPSSSNPRLKDKLNLFYTHLALAGAVVGLIRIYLAIDGVRNTQRGILEAWLPDLGAMSADEEEIRDGLIAIQRETGDLFVERKMLVSDALTVVGPATKTKEAELEAREDLELVIVALGAYHGKFYLEDGSYVG